MGNSESNQRTLESEVESYRQNEWNQHESLSYNDPITHFPITVAGLIEGEYDR